MELKIASEYLKNEAPLLKASLINVDVYIVKNERKIY
jgi:hypothetical protein